MQEPEKERYNETERKAEQRRLVLQRRIARSSEQREKDSRLICETVLRSGIYHKANTVLLFKAFGSEVDLSIFEEAAKKDGKVLLYPFCPDQEYMLALRPGEAWETDRFGIRVPVLSEAEEADPASIDLVLCPCAGFDDSGRRLGMGRGYYDRFLPKCPQAFRLLAAFEAQCLPEVVTGSQDVPMNGIVTEARMVLL